MLTRVVADLIAEDDQSTRRKVSLSRSPATTQFSTGAGCLILPEGVARAQPCAGRRAVVVCRSRESSADNDRRPRAGGAGRVPRPGGGRRCPRRRLARMGRSLDASSVPPRNRGPRPRRPFGYAAARIARRRDADTAPNNRPRFKPDPDSGRVPHVSNGERIALSIRNSDAYNRPDPRLQPEQIGVVHIRLDLARAQGGAVDSHVVDPAERSAAP
jgi:hypothetical protein